MNANGIHQRARRLILDLKAMGLEQEESRWLDRHLDECAKCAAYAVSTERALAVLRMASETPSPTLVRATEFSVRRSARNLGDVESSRRMIVVSCCLAAAFGAVFQPYLWRLFGWAGAYLNLPDPAWQAAFVAMWLLPGIVSVLLLTHLPAPSRSSRGIGKGRNG